MELIKTNKYQTPVTQELLDSLPQEVSEQLMESLTNIQFIRNLISPDRLYFKDLPRDERGAAIVDITDPPILTDSDYFRQPALHFLKHGCYTFLKPNSNPNSEYRKFWDEEIRRCWEGLIRPEDGAWVSGYNYWFLNYQPMMVNRINAGRKTASRVEEFPFMQEGNLWRYYYLQYSRYNGKHSIELAKRGAHPYFQKVHTPEGIKEWKDINIGDRLFGTYGNITVVTDIPFDGIADTYRITLRDGRTVYASDDHLWNIEGRKRTMTTAAMYKRYNKVKLFIPETEYNPLMGNIDRRLLYPVPIEEMGYIGKFPCKCVTVDAEDSSYLIGDFVQTHNCGKSYSLAAIMEHNLLLGENKESRKRCITILTAYQKEYLKDDKDGTLSKFRPAINFLASNTPFPHLMLKNSPNEMSWQMGYKDEYGVEKGSFNSVMAVPLKEDSDKLRGKRATILFEEMGTMSNLLSVYDTCRRSVEDGSYTFNQMYLVGTSNNEESDFQSAKILLTNPDAYNIYSVPNLYDKPKQGKSRFGYFFPAYINRAGCYNEDGVSDVVKALIEVLLQRFKARHGADPQSVLRVIAEDPVTPAEAMIKVKSAYFPVTALNERLQQLDSDPHAYDDVYVGDLVIKDNNVEFKPTNDVPIKKYGVPNDTPGALEIFAMPEKNRDGKVYNNRYIIGYDPLNTDAAESTSLASIFVLDTWTDTIVAEYTGRKAFVDDVHELCRLLCIFFNAKCLYESNIKGCFAYFSKMNSLHLLADTPEYLRDKQLIKYSSYGNNAKGVNATAAVNNYANGLIRDWLMQPVIVITKNDNGEEQEVSLPRLYQLRNRAFIEELIAFNPEINVDRIRSFGLVMLYREEKMILYQGNPGRDKDEIPSDYLGNDPFFSKNYGSKFNKKYRVE